MCLGPFDWMAWLAVIMFVTYVGMQITCDEYDDWYEKLKQTDFVEEYQPYQALECPENFNPCHESQFCELVSIETNCKDTDIRCVSEKKTVCNNILQPNEEEEDAVDRGDNVQWDSMNNDYSENMSMDEPDKSTDDLTTVLPKTTAAPTILISIPNPILDRNKRNASNCEYFPKKRTYRCDDWNSPTLQTDIKSARQNSILKLKRKYPLRIYSGPVPPMMDKVLNKHYNATSDFDTENTEWVTRFIFVPCFNHWERQYHKWNKLRIRSKLPKDFRLMKLAVTTNYKCHLPLTPLRKKIKMDFIYQLNDMAKDHIAKRFLATMGDRTSFVSTISAAKENSYLKKSVKGMFRRMSPEVYNEPMIQSLLNQTNTIPEVDDEIIKKRMGRLYNRINERTSLGKVVEELLGSARTSDIK